MSMTLKLKADVLALLEFVKDKKASEGDPWSDTKAATLCFNHGEFVGTIRRWIGGPGGPTMEKFMRFENFLRDQLTDDEFRTFQRSIGEAVPEKPSTLDGWR